MKPTAVLPHPFSAWRLSLLRPIFCLSACGSLLPKPAAAPTRHTLDASASVASASAMQARASPSATTAVTAPVLVVAVPRAAPGHDSTRMVYLQQLQQLRAFA
ncbi:MAG: hypothetical protein Q8M96_18510, partial [Rubrivivax sp.]|nr:hypothetical protein [Rubrivivax sp.]